MTSWAKEEAKLYSQFDADLKATHWGPVQAQADALHTALGKMVAKYTSLSEATDVDSWDGFMGDLTADHELTAADNGLRSALMMPQPTPGLL